MATTTETVLIEFVSDSTGLLPAEDKLAALGKIDKAAADTFKQSNAELQKRVQQYNAIAQSSGKVESGLGVLKHNVVDLDKYMHKFIQNFTEGFQEGIIDALKEAGLEFDQTSGKFKKGAEEAAKSTDSFRAQLKKMNEELTSMKLAGQDGTAAFKKLEAEAANLKDTMGDVATSIKNAGSDTAVFDGLLSITGAVAGGFSAAQGAVALFGKESEELQEVLLRVNAAMAIVQGLTSVQNALLKESAGRKLIDTVATKGQAAATALATGVMRAFGVAAVETSVAFKVLRTAIITTGIGALVVAVGFLVEKLISLTSNTDDAAESQRKLKEALMESAAAAREAGFAFLDNEEKLAVARAKLAGKTEQEIFNIQQNFLREKIKSQERYLKEVAGGGEKQLEAERELDKLKTELFVNDVERQKEVQENAKKAAEKAKELAKKTAEEARKERVSALNDQLAILERQLLAAEKGGQIEIDIQKKIIAKKAELALAAEGLTENQIRLIKEKSLQDQLDLQNEFNKKSSQLAIEGLISRNNAELQQLNLSNEEKLRLTIENIISLAQIEADAAEGNSSKIKEINAKRDADIKAARLKSLQEALDYELQLQEAREGANNRALNKIANDEKASLAERFAAIDALADYDIMRLTDRTDALNESFSKGLISQKEYNLQYNKLVDETAQVVENAEQRKLDAIKKTNEERKAATIAQIQEVVAFAQEAQQLLTSIFDFESQRDNARLDAQKSELKELREAGVISEKEAEKRQRKIEAEEKRIRLAQAKREKAIAVFQSLIAIPVAFGKGLQQGGLPLAIIYAAAAAAQAALVASRPIPKFRTGKKDSYTGPAEVGEAGAELIEQNGRLFLAKKSTLLWLGPKDKVYNPEETQKMIFKPQPTSQKLLIQNSGKQAIPFEIDYDKLAGKIGEQIAQKTPQTVLNITEKGMSELVKKGNSSTEYLEKRRRF